MADDERVLESFCEGEEELRAAITVRAIRPSGDYRPPQMGDDETLGVSDDRLLWFDDELREIDRERIASVDREAVEHPSAPTSVRVGGVCLLLGLVASAGAFLLTDWSLPATLAPLFVGAVVFAVTLLLARLRGQTDDGATYPLLRVDHDDGSLMVWGDDETLDAVTDALDGD